MNKAIKIKELSKYINNLVKRDPILANLFVEGEVSNFKSSGGNIYFVLKDDNAALRCIIFKNMDLAKTISIQDGMNIVARGSLTTYDYGSYYQLLVKEIITQGIGDIYQRFEILKNKLLNQGYFNLEHKKKIPKMPSSIGVITSSTGAAVRDIIDTVHRRFPICDIYLYPSLVQGVEASASLIKGLEYFNNNKKVDVIIIGRGGGSFEDLDCFNNELLLYKIFESNIPVISAVGHEVDNMLSDFVADLRAATPTAAGELATPVLLDLKNDIFLLKRKLDKLYLNYFDEEKKLLNFFLTDLKYYNPIEKINNLKLELVNKIDKITMFVVNQQKHQEYLLNDIKIKLEKHNPIDKIYREKEKLELFDRLLITNFINNLEYEKYVLKSIKNRIDMFNSEKILRYGYAKIFINDKSIKSIEEININDTVNIHFDDGIATATIDNKEKKIG